MRKSLVKMLGVAGLTISVSAYSAGMGSINVVSSLGQPLKANIELVSVDPNEDHDLNVHLASPQMYRSAGLEYPSGNKFNFDIVKRAEGGAFLVVTTDGPVYEPFVSLMVEMSWPSGRLLREYTFLLDPEDYQPVKPPLPMVETVAPQVTTRKQPPEPVAQPPAEPPQMQPPSEEVAPPPQTQPRQTDRTGLARFKQNAPVVEVKPGDTLRRIARNNQPQDVSLERMLVAIYRANKEQFDDQNMNRIQVGRELRMPTLNEVLNVSQDDALREIRVQAQDWNQYRQRLSSVAADRTRPQAESKQTSGGQITPAVEDQSEVVKPEAEEVLRLSKGEQPDDKVTTDKQETAPITPEDLEEEETIAQQKTAEEAEMRASLLEKNLKDMELLAKLKAEAQRAAEQRAAEKLAPEQPQPAQSEVQPEKAQSAPQPVKVPEPAAAESDEEKTLIDKLIDNAIYIGGAVAVLLLFLALLLMWKRRRDDDSEVFIDEYDSSDEVTPPVITMPEMKDATVSEDLKPEAEPEEELLPDEVDPISEAELFLNFGRDQQAEDILLEALKTNPDNHQIHLKLLAIYAGRPDVNAFAGIARQLKETGDEPAWEQAAAMGRKIDPSNPDYASDGADVDDQAIEDTISATQAVAGQTSPDFVIGDEDDEVDSKEQTSQSPALDFDFGDESDDNFQQTQVLDTSDTTAAEDSQRLDLEFDLDDDKQSAQETDSMLDLDLSDETESGTKKDEASADVDTDTASGPEDNELDFDFSDETSSADDQSNQSNAESADNSTDADQQDDSDKAEPEAEFELDLEEEKEPEPAVAPNADLELEGLDESAAAGSDSDEEKAQTEESSAQQASTEDHAIADDPDLSLDLELPTSDDHTADQAEIEQTEAQDTGMDQTEAEKEPETDKSDETEQETETTASSASQTAVEEPDGLADLSLDLTEESEKVNEAPADESSDAEEPERSEQWHEVATKLDLARAYQEMGDAVGAREILDEVMQEGDEEQIKAAQKIMQELG